MMIILHNVEHDFITEVHPVNVIEKRTVLHKKSYLILLTCTFTVVPTMFRIKEIRSVLDPRFADLHKKV